jgi:hypothetical protein
VTDGELAVIGLVSAGSMALWQAAKLTFGVLGFEARTPSTAAAPSAATPGCSA